MKLKFTKMQGCGNDYVYVNCFDKELDDPGSISAKISPYHFGIGSDGLICICRSKVADAKMRMFNLDGSEGKMCGNGIRCVAKFLYDYNLVKKEILTVETLSGIKTLKLNIEDDKVKSVCVDMGAPILKPSDVPVDLDGDVVIDRPVDYDGEIKNITCVSMGNPHAVIFVDDVDNLDLVKIGPKFENNKIFPERVNTEFVKVIDENTLQMRVWERGSGETWACGTGTCATVVAAVLNGHCNKDEDVTVHLRGGDLVIKYTDDTVFMTGGCEIVFEGEIEL